MNSKGVMPLSFEISARVISLSLDAKAVMLGSSKANLLWKFHSSESLLFVKLRTYSGTRCFTVR